VNKDPERTHANGKTNLDHLHPGQLARYPALTCPRRTAPRRMKTLQGARRFSCVARAWDAPGHSFHCVFSRSFRPQPGTHTLGGGEACPAISQWDQGGGASPRQLVADRYLHGCGLGESHGQPTLDWRRCGQLESKKQTCVALSSTEAEYMALC
jgi:hypothetical protein